MTQLNIREREVVDELVHFPSFKSKVLDHLVGEFGGEARKVLAALATAIDFRRRHPKPEVPPFHGKKPRLELPVFFLGYGFIKGFYVCSGVHTSGWVVFFTTQVTTQIHQFEAERLISMVADWELTPIPWLAEAIDPDRRSALKIEGAGNASNIDLYPHFIKQSYGTVGT